MMGANYSTRSSSCVISPISLANPPPVSHFGRDLSPIGDDLWPRALGFVLLSLQVVRVDVQTKVKNSSLCSSVRFIRSWAACRRSLKRCAVSALCVVIRRQVIADHHHRHRAERADGTERRYRPTVGDGPPVVTVAARLLVRIAVFGGRLRAVLGLGVFALHPARHASISSAVSASASAFLSAYSASVSWSRPASIAASPWSESS